MKARPANRNVTLGTRIVNAALLERRLQTGGPLLGGAGFLVEDPLIQQVQGAHQLA